MRVLLSPGGERAGADPARRADRSRRGARCRSGDRCGVGGTDLGHRVRRGGAGGAAGPGLGSAGPIRRPSLDRATRLAYDLMSAAAESGVRRCVYLSSLRLLAGYPAHHTVTEGWRPLPPSDDAALLGCHLGEQIASGVRARTPHGGGHGAAGLPGRSRTRAAPSTTRTATLPSAPTTWWPWCPPRSRRRSAQACTVVHAQSPVADARYLMPQAMELLGYPEEVRA